MDRKESGKGVRRRDVGRRLNKLGRASDMEGRSLRSNCSRKGEGDLQEEIRVERLGLRTGVPHGVQYSRNRGKEIPLKCKNPGSLAFGWKKGDREQGARKDSRKGGARNQDAGVHKKTRGIERAGRRARSRRISQNCAL